MAIEYEVKLRGEREELLAALERIGARPRGARVLEDDLVLDTPAGELRARGGLLRLRRRGDAYLLTLKERCHDAAEVKAMTEVETAVDDGGAMERLLQHLGFRVAMRYQKYRTTFACDAAGCDELAVTLDETPLGCFLELEGDPECIHRCAAALGFSREDYETRSYLEIHRVEKGDGDMVFEGNGAAGAAASAGGP
jgi:adenylate cyclase class 2